MSEPPRWRDEQGGASERARALVRAGGAPVALTAAQRARGLAAVERIASLPVRPWWISARVVGWSATALALGVAAALIVLARRAPPARRPPVAIARRVSAAQTVRPSVAVVLPVPVPVPVRAPDPVVVVAPPAPLLAPAVREASRGTVLVGARARAGHATPDAGEPVVVDRLVAENALIRRMLGADPRGVLALVAQYDAEFPSGTNYDLRAWLEVQALARLGRTDDARAHAVDALRRSPGGIYTAQLNRLLDGGAARHESSDASTP